MKRLFSFLFLLAMAGFVGRAQVADSLVARQNTIMEARYLKSVFKVDEAIDTLSTLVGAAFDEEVLAELADCHYQNGDFENAAGTYTMLSSLRPDNLLYKVRLAAVMYRLKAYSQAIEYGKETMAADTIPALMSLVGDAFNQTEKPDSALVYYKLSLEKRPQSQAVVSKVAKLYLDKKDYQAALAAVEPYLEIVPDDFDIAPIKGLALYLTEAYEPAIEIFERQLELGNDNYGVHYNLGQCYMLTKEPKKAEKEYLSAWQIDSSDVNLAFSIAGAKAADPFKFFELDVRPWLDKVLEMVEPDHTLMSKVHQQYGFGYYKKLDSWDKAIEHYKEAYNYNPSLISALSTIAYCYEQKKDYKSAIIWYEKYLKVANPGTKGYNFAKESLDFLKGELFMDEK